jgi:hypothetical protein
VHLLFESGKSVQHEYNQDFNDLIGFFVKLRSYFQT